MNDKIVTRIAPSPTGKLHIGTARTALFNYLFARQNGGKFLLRIEDTDRARSSDEHVEDIMTSLDWLGLDWDNKGSEHFQSQHLAEYQAIARKLIDDGYAYEKEGAIYFRPSSVNSTVLEVSFNDLVHGNVTVKIEDIEDFVILKSDGWPTFHLAVVIDDHAMGVSHVIRGDDHLPNTPKHILLFQALDYELPIFGHLPLIVNPDKTKMSKRKDPVSVTDDYKVKGYLPEAINNFMALLGWNPKTNDEFFTLDELVSKFNFDGIQKSNAVFDKVKLNYFNAHYLRSRSDSELVQMVSPIWNESYNTGQFDQKYLEGVARLSVSRAQTVIDMSQDVDYFFNAPELDRDSLVFKKSTPETTSRGLVAVYEQLNDISESDWKTETLYQSLTQAVVDNGLSNGDVFWPVRYGLSGVNASPKPEELMTVFGKTESLKRLSMAIKLLQ